MRRRALCASTGSAYDWSIDYNMTLNVTEEELEEHHPPGSSVVAPWDIPQVYTLAQQMCKTIGREYEITGYIVYEVSSVPPEHKVTLNNNMPLKVSAYFYNEGFSHAVYEYTLYGRPIRMTYLQGYLILEFF